MPIQDAPKSMPAAAKPAVAGVTVAPAKGFVTVRALRQGFCPGTDSNGRHWLREAGSVFTVEEKAFAGEWMMRADGEIPELPPVPPPTTLPTRPRPLHLGQ